MPDNYALFGPAGNSDSFTASHKSSVEAPGWLYDLGLDVYEYQCGKGVRIKDETAEELGGEARKHGIKLSLHAPYFISLSNPNNLEKNIEYVLQSCNAAKHMGADRIVVHSGSVGGMGRSGALENTIGAMRIILDETERSGYGEIMLCPETMGKINQLGTYEEVLEICRVSERLIPCIDFGHLYARTLGGFEGMEKAEELFDEMENMLGVARASVFHSHFSKIEYTAGGEKRHLTFENTEFGPDFRPVARALVKRGYSPRFICESAGTQAEDALEMKHIYYEELENVL
ncbi:MAG: TIM barrel protein [Oscillospiraceae bacterium]|jgi:deoxyribonuclease-4|nr:TIM barrel protein [Oscillospiraceae bacterium]